jgi:hypothetical protein
VGWPMKVGTLMGPDGAAPSDTDERVIEWAAFAGALKAVRDYLRVNGRVPARVMIGAEAVSPADFLVGMARVWAGYEERGKLQREGVRLGRGVEVLPGRLVAKDSPGVFGGWIIHREGFRAPKVLEVGRWQAWTLKPAVRE